MDFGLDFFLGGFGSYYILRTSAWLACALWTTTYRSAHERERKKAIDTDEYKNVCEGDLKHASVSVPAGPLPLTSLAPMAPQWDPNGTLNGTPMRPCKKLGVLLIAVRKGRVCV